MQKFMKDFFKFLTHLVNILKGDKKKTDDNEDGGLIGIGTEEKERKRERERRRRRERKEGRKRQG